MNFTELEAQIIQYCAELPPFQEPADRSGNQSLSACIDHTLLKPEATPMQIKQLCEEAIRHHFASVCINPIFVQLAADRLAGTSVKVCTVIGFPLGATPTRIKVAEARASLEMGAKEIDMVIPIGLLRDHQYETVFEDILSVAESSHSRGAITKVILEMAYLEKSEKIAGCLISQAAGAEFVKTSTGFGPSGANAADVELMRRVVGPSLGVKAAGGVRTLADARTMLAAGATRLGSSAGVKIMLELEAEGHS
jgi:deoxyribose-phosphate aldolase